MPGTKKKLVNKLTPAQKSKIRALRKSKQKKDTMGSSIRSAFGLSDDPTFDRAKKRR